MNGRTDIFEQVKDFLQNLLQSFREGLLFIGEPLDVLIAILDIAVAAAFFYFILKIVRDSRAWQLLKGIALIIFISVISNLIGLDSVGFLLNNTISIFAIAFVVIFQPELRRALETVGRSSFNVISGNLVDAKSGNLSTAHAMIEAIVNACDYFSKTKTGALIVIERSTPLGDLEEQENAFRMDDIVTETMLKQIFYLGTPLHDGAVLIRQGRIKAARVHIPLSDNYHLRKDFGTRHRAAIGASEMGDAIAVVVSEERGTISFAVDGRLYVLDNSDALRTQLHQALNLDDEEETKRFGFLRRRIKNRKERRSYLGSDTKPKRKQRVGLLVISIILSVSLWLYVQITVNPIDSKNFQVDLVYEHQETLAERGLEMAYPVRDVQIRIIGRKNLMESLTNSDITAYVDLNEINEVGIHKLPVQVKKNTSLYTRTENLSPETVTVVVRPYDYGEQGGKND